MAFVRFGDDGYDYCDNGYHILFTEDKSHKHLFDYITKDLSELPKLLELYVSQKMDITTFDLQDHQYDDNYSNEIIKILKSAHPYYEHECIKVFLKAIGCYFNHLLIHSSYKNNILYNTYDEQWFLKRLKAITSPFLQGNGINQYLGEFYAEYRYKVSADVHESIEETFAYLPYETLPAQGFIDEIRTQEYVKKMLFWILDISVQKIGKLSIPQRIWLYENIVHRAYGRSEKKVTKYLAFSPAFLFQKNNYNISDMDDLFRPLYTLSEFNIDHDGIPLETLDVLNGVISIAKNVSKPKVYEEYEINNLHQLLYLEILLMIQAGMNIRRCKNCGKYFVVPNRKMAYCDRKASEKESCAMIGAKRTFEKKMKAEPALEMYTRAYKTHHARIRNGIMTAEMFSNWKEEANEKLAKVRAGEMNISDFEKWLKK